MLPSSNVQLDARQNWPVSTDCMTSTSLLLHTLSRERTRLRLRTTAHLQNEIANPSVDFTCSRFSHRIMRLAYFPGLPLAIDMFQALSLAFARLVLPYPR